MTNISNILVDSNAGNTALVTHNINENTTVDLTNYTTMMVIRSTGEYTITINDPTKEMQDVLVKNDSIYTITLVMGSTGSVDLTPGLTIKIIPTGTEGNYIWYAVSANEIDFDDTIPPLGSVEYKIYASDAEYRDFFGRSVSMNANGTKCIVGAYQEDEGGNQAGATYIFSWDGTTWVEDQKLIASDSWSLDSFGDVVSMSDDGTKVLIGAYGAEETITGDGNAYVFTFDGSTWTEQQRLDVSDPERDDNFGVSVSISGDGTKCIVGARLEDTGGSNAGAAYIFSWNGATWVEDQKIQASDAEAGDYFGYAVSMNVDGTKCIVGAYGEDTGGADTGAAYIFSLDGTWSQDQKIQAGDAEVSDYFGSVVSMSGDGTKCIVGAYGEDTGGSLAGAAYIFSLDGTWSQDQKIVPDTPVSSIRFGSSVSMSGDGLLVAVGGYVNNGKVWLFSSDGLVWSQDQVFSDDSSGFGNSVSLSRDASRLLVGNYADDTIAEYAGAAYIY